jgi:hypothetical protein
LDVGRQFWSHFAQLLLLLLCTVLFFLSLATSGVDALDCVASGTKFSFVFVLFCFFFFASSSSPTKLVRLFLVCFLFGSLSLFWVLSLSLSLFYCCFVGVFLCLVLGFCFYDFLLSAALIVRDVASGFSAE